MKAIAFSKDRALQLDGMLRSLAMHASEPVDVTVIWKSTTARHQASYEQVGDLHPGVSFACEIAFEPDFRRHLASTGEHVLFLVDDTIFVREWSNALCERMLLANGRAIGFSLRLGRNTTNCYPMNRAQTVPDLPGPGPYDAARGWSWPGADGDFGYPLEVSSSVYRTSDILAFLSGAQFRNPNELEAALATVAERSPVTRSVRPWLMAYETSVAFSNPCNRVQTIFANRAGDAPAQSADALLEMWEHGYQMRVESYAGFTPSGAHEQVPIYVERRP